MDQIKPSIEVEVAPPGPDASLAERIRAHLANLRGRTWTGSLLSRSMSPFPVVTSAGHSSRWSMWTIGTFLLGILIHEYSYIRCGRRDEAKYAPTPDAPRRRRRKALALADQRIPCHDPHLDGGGVVPSYRTSQGRPGVP
jgi:hypothetical protein